MRLLYVAMTRAKRFLFLTACVRNAAALAEIPNPEPSLLSIIQVRRFADWALMGERSALSVRAFLRTAALPEGPVPESPGLPEADPVLLEQLNEHLSWRYAHASACVLPAKASVSQIVRSRQLPGAELPEFASPAFLNPSPQKSSTFIGTAVHLALQYLPLSLDPGTFHAEAYLESCVQAGHLAPEQADAVQPESLSWFVFSPLFRSMQESPRLERELSVSALADAGELFGSGAGESVLLQGVIDCCFLSDGEWVILDYKTDHIPPGQTPEQAAAKHALQLQLYASALEALTGIPVREALVVLLFAKTAVSIPLHPDLQAGQPD